MDYYIYILECADQTLYCGYTIDLEKRVFNHNNSDVGAKYTKARRPVKLVYFETVSSLSEALKREHQIKKLTKKQKQMLINGSM
jgi:putative endonuclease